jgi:16S rRNA (guanine(966)-N(2))-methyltransferase RsmD
MRVIGGELRSRVIKSLPGLDVRPTPDRLREALFNVLAPRIEGAIFADLYAGTGAVGIEALSRGASRAVFIEQSHASVRIIRENLKALGLEARAEIRHGRVSSKCHELKADIVFLDPPYRLEREYESTLGLLGEMPHAMSEKPPVLLRANSPLVIAQHSSKLALRESYGALSCVRVLKQGENALSFFEPPGQ